MEREEEKAKLLLPLRPLYEGGEGGKDGDRFVRVATPKKLSSTLARTLNGPTLLFYGGEKGRGRR